MKKISIVLMVAVLAVGFVFAETAFSGSAELDFDYELGTGTYGLTNGSSVELTWAYALDAGEGSAMGEGEIYAEIEGAFSFDFEDQDEVTASDSDVTFASTLSIDTANIHVGDLTIGLLGPGVATDYAKTYYDNDDDDDVDGDDTNFEFSAPEYVELVVTVTPEVKAEDAKPAVVAADPYFDTTKGEWVEAVEAADAVVAAPESTAISYTNNDVEGFTFNYADVFNGGFGFNGQNMEENNWNSLLVYAWGGVADMEVFDGLTVSANAYATFKHLTFTGATFDENTFDFGFSAKAAYATDDVTADAAVDYSGKTVEFAANAEVAGVTANAYLYTTNMATFLGDAKVSTTIEDITVYAEIRDIWAPGVVTVGESATFGSLDQEASVSYDLAKKTLSAAASETYTYTADTFTVYETVDVALDILSTFALTSIAPEVGISSDVIVDGATLSAKWADAEFVGTSKSLGAVTASCTIEF